MRLFRRKPRITDEIYGRAVDLDPFIAGPAEALAARTTGELAPLAYAVDGALYRGAAHYHMRLLAGSWLMAHDGSVPRETAEVFEEAVAWKFGPLVKGSGELAHRVSALARGEGERVD
jgi:hypothetical protein